MTNLSISLIQTPLHWENSEKNLKMLASRIKNADKKTDLIILPEMFSTGFTMNAQELAEPMSGKAVSWMKEQASNTGAVIAGSLLIDENEKYFNRFMWVRPDGSYEYYDKRHLFRMANEHKTMSMGFSTKIVQIRDWKINLQVCYDLRFPVWSRNSLKNDQPMYDLLLYVANWPAVRRKAYKSLLPARAIENQAWVVWVNRIEKDGNGYDHSGDSAVYDPEGNLFATAGTNIATVLNVTLTGDLLPNLRKKFKVSLDWDNFNILPDN